MSHRVAWRIALPMTGLGVVLLGLGVAAAWNVHHQQSVASEFIAREVESVIAIEELHLEMRELRYQVNLYLRTQDIRHLEEVVKAHATADKLLADAKSFARNEDEVRLILQVESGYQNFFDQFQPLFKRLAATANSHSNGGPVEQFPSTLETQITNLSDHILTDEVLKPLKECIEVNKEVVKRANEASQATAQHLRIGFLLLGLCGGVAGLLMGVGIARAVRQSIVQLDISVRSVAGRLSDLTGPVKFSQVGDLKGLEAGLKQVEGEIAGVVERLQQQEIELLRSEQLARVGQLAAGLAHELRNPLMPMKMLVQAALEKGDDSGLKGRALQVINDEIARLEQSIQYFLDFARPPTPEKTDAAFQELVRQAVDLVSGRARSQSVELNVQLPDTPIMMRVDRGQIHQLLLNLILNAMDSLTEGGTVRLVASIEEGESTAPQRAVRSLTSDSSDEFAVPETLRIAAHSSAVKTATARRWLVLKVADTGAGIPPEMLPKIFDPFVTTKETGTGLGLTICRRIVAAHQGTIKAANRPEGGAEFTVLLPCA